MKRDKTPSSSRGAQIRCVNFIMCPLCYGCRNYRSDDPECENCLKDKKFNICNTDKHQPHLIASFISRSQIQIKGDIQFKSYEG
jgi:hypothetical protein